MVMGNHRVFVITVQKCKCYIFQLVIILFDQYHQYLYILHIISFCCVFSLPFTKGQKQTSRGNYHNIKRGYSKYVIHNGTGRLLRIVVHYS